MFKYNDIELILNYLGFTKRGTIFSKSYSNNKEAYLKVDTDKREFIYPEDKGLKINEKQTTNFSAKENIVVFECVDRLFEKGYKPEHIELEPKWKLGHGASGGRADIMIKDFKSKPFLIIECKTFGNEFVKEWNNTLHDGGQLFSYAIQDKNIKNICLYTSGLVDNSIVFTNHIIALKDSKTQLDRWKDKEIISYEEAKNNIEYFQAWKHTYEHDYSTKGIFEESVLPYEIGKSKITIDDLSEITSLDIQGKYHEFATILRQHNVSGRENAFDKLVNLFLCKIVDEKNNPKDLQFYWKGMAYDSYFDLQDRIQSLYKKGMMNFLKEEVTYIDNDQIDNAFRYHKVDPDATYKSIRDIFRELKYFTNNDFTFIDVHNEKLFFQNGDVLKKIVQMLQDIKLKTNTENQFLGDMFEGFLDQGVKQSEGQYFTPMPIVKFILKSLPLENLIINIDKHEIPKAIDYACGAGHFLNEYAQEIKPIVEAKTKNNIEDYYKNTIGIEKEYRLSKVAKVSAFMYGQDDINIIYADALSDIPDIKNGELSLLVANPPYSVKGFLETLSNSERKQFELINTIEEKSYANNNSIETFFIERAKQLLKSEGVAAIIVPSSILTKGNAKAGSKSVNTYVATREILIKYFDIIAIAEFGSGTFGKTGTNTVTLFLRRKKIAPNPSDHYEDRINNWFNDSDIQQETYKDKDLLKKYCSHLEFDYKEYKTLLQGIPSNKLLEHQVFKDYKTEFDKLSEIKNLKKQKTFKEKTKIDQNKELNERFLLFIKEIEKEKVYFFILAYTNSQKVIIVKSPTKSAEIKDFLGYEWSSAKGNEGIKYLASDTVDIDEEIEDELDTEDKRIVSNLINLENINTPLYDPHNTDNENKINTLIKRNFNNQEFIISDDLAPFVTTASLIDMIDFEKVDFNKAISLTPNRKQYIESKWNLIKINDITNDIQKGMSITQKDTKEGVYKVVAGGTNFAYTHNQFNRDAFTITVSASGANAGFINFWKEKIFASDCTTIRGKNDIETEYIFNVLKYICQEDIYLMAKGSAQPHVYPEDIKSLKIPLPDPKIQKQIVKECSLVDQEVEKAKIELETSKNLIAESFSALYNTANTKVKLNEPDKFEVSIGRRVLKTEFKSDGKVPVFSANVHEPFGNINKLLISDFSRPSILWGIDGDWMVNYYPKDKPFYPTDHCGVIRVKATDIHPRYLAFALYKEGENLRFSRSNRASTDRVKNITIRVVDYPLQEAFAKKIETIEKAIKKAEVLIENATKQKEVILKKYL